MRTTSYGAKSDLSLLIKKACAGEVIARGDTPVVHLVPLAPPPRKRRFGALKARTTAAFFEPLPTSEIDVWEK